jgi:DNA-binding XRE family transcriptional regulator
MANRAKKISSKTACKIRELRNQAGLTQKELSALLNLNSVTYLYYEKHNENRHFIC